MAAAAARSGPEHVSNLVQQALDLAGSGADAARVTLALEIQAAIAEEVNDADRTARGVLVNLCIPRLVEVLGTAEAVLDASSVDPALAALRAAALRAALAWLRLDERGGRDGREPGYVGAESRGADAGRASGVGGGRLRRRRRGD